MPKITITRDLAHSAATDAANRSARKGGRKAWSGEDYNIYVDTFDRLWPLECEYGKEMAKRIREKEKQNNQNT